MATPKATIHLWDMLADMTRYEGKLWTKCGRYIREPANVLFASTAEKLRIPPSAVCKVCYRLGPPWLVAVK